MPVELPHRPARSMDRAYRRKVTVLTGVIIGLAAVFCLGFFVDFGAMLNQLR